MNFIILSLAGYYWQMKEAIEDHHASNKHALRSIYGKIVAEADRIIDPYERYDVPFIRIVSFDMV